MLEAMYEPPWAHPAIEAHPVVVIEAARLARLEADFPQFRIWREISLDRARYVACRLQPGTHPHTVVAADLGELREVLAAGQSVSRSARQGS
jgi:hypothetical protein